MTATAVDRHAVRLSRPAAAGRIAMRDCGTVTFPAQAGCAKCTGSDMAPVELPDRGTLWTWTVQAFEPKPPYRAPDTGFTPYGVGYVDLGEVIVESRLIGDPSRFEIGTPMRLDTAAGLAGQRRRSTSSPMPSSRGGR